VNSGQVQQWHSAVKEKEVISNRLEHDILKKKMLCVLKEK
jgi:hypothetical protein